MKIVYTFLQCEFFMQSSFVSLTFFFILLSLSMHGEEILLTIPTATSIALQNNRQFMESIDAVAHAQFAIELNDSKFEFGIVPNARTGYVGGGHAGQGWSLGGGVEMSKQFISGTQIAIEPSILKFPDHYQTQIRGILTQPLLRGLGAEYQLSGVLAAQFSKRTACRNLYIAQVNLIVRTIQLLYEVTKAKEIFASNQESFDRMNRFYQSAQLKEKMGLCDSLDIYRAETELRITKESLAASQERLEESEDLLRDLLALPPDTFIQIDIPLAYTPSRLSPEVAIQIALENRIEIDQDADQLRENKRLLRLAKNNRLPELNLVLNYTNCGNDEVFTRSCRWRHRESTWGVGFTTATDFDPLPEKIAYQKCLLDNAAGQRDLEQTETTLILETKRSLRLLAKAYDRIQLQKEQIIASESELRLAEVKFQHGMTSNFHVIQAEKSLRGAHQNYWSAMIDHIIGEFQLLATLGLLIDKPCINCK